MHRPIALVAASVLTAPALLVLASTSAVAGGVTCQGHHATIVGTTHQDVLHGTPGDDVIVGLAGRDTIDGGGGDDIICGGRDGDTLIGGAGDDQLYGKRSIDTLTGGDGDDLLAGGSGTATTFDYSDAPRGVTVDLEAGTASGWGRDTVSFGHANIGVLGSRFDDDLLGTEGPDGLRGDGGTDRIDGRGGDDRLLAQGGSLVGGDGDDYLHGYGGGGFTTTLDGGAGADILDQDSSGSIVGGSGDDSVWTDLSDAPFTAGQTIDGGDGTDLLMLSDLAGRYDHLAFDLASGLLDADGTDVAATGFENFETRGDISGDTTSYDVTGTDGANRFYVQQTNESVVIHAAGGDDVITGGNGDDTLDGGPGDDTASAGDGTDTCVSVEHATGCESVSP
jgi:Ca2+-binding RTX toxin-like protein